MASDPHSTSAPELKAQIEAERAGRPFLVFRDGEGGQRIVTAAAGESELWVGERFRRRAARLGRGGLRPARADQGRPRRVHAGRRRPLPQRLLRQRGAGHGRRHLRDGDTIRFGRTAVVYRRPGEGAADRDRHRQLPVPPPRRLPGPAQGPASPSAVLTRTAAASRRRRPTSRSATSCTSASTRSRPTCAPSSRSSASATCRRTSKRVALVERALHSRRRHHVATCDRPSTRRWPRDDPGQGVRSTPWASGRGGSEGRSWSGAERTHRTRRKSP